MTDLEALKARLREVESSRPDIIGISTHWHRNPEGPEAADAIERLEAENAKLRTLVADYVDPFDVASEDEALVVAVQIAAFREYKG